jgi:hypothetical protein
VLIVRSRIRDPRSVGNFFVSLRHPRDFVRNGGVAVNGLSLGHAAPGPLKTLEAPATAWVVP